VATPAIRHWKAGERLREVAYEERQLVDPCFLRSSDAVAAGPTGGSAPGLSRVRGLRGCLPLFRMVGRRTLGRNLGSGLARLAGIAVLIAAWVASGALAVTAHAVPPGANGRIAIAAVYWYECGDCDPDFTGWTASRGARPLPISGASQVAFSPDGKRLAFVRPGRGIYLTRPGGSRRRLLTRRLLYPDHLAWSPRGDKLAFSGGGGDLYVIGARGGSPRRLFSTNSEISDFGWAPSGAELAFASYGGGGDSAAIRGVRLDGGLRQLGSGWHVSWSAAGWLAYERTDGLYVSRLDSTPERRLVPYHRGPVDLYDDGIHQSVYSWSPEGERIAFTRGGRIFVARAAAGEAQPITSRGACCPEWSPDGRLVAFARGRAVFVVPARGGRSRLFTRVPSSCTDCDEWVHGLDWQARPRTP
jgi:dipeptidyl aminopeptidase/acylaminoacyl peptidase